MQSFIIGIVIWGSNMGLYDFILKDKNGDTIAILDSIRNRYFEFYLNKPGSASFNISPLDIKAKADNLLVGNKELYIYRANFLIWGGELSQRRTDVDVNRENIQVSAKGFFDLLSKKFTGLIPGSPRIFSNEYLSDIAWTLIDESQTGGNAYLGITRGSNPITRLADRTFEFKSVKDAIEGLSNLNVENGIDFEIDANKQFNVFYPQKGIKKPEVVFEFGKNIISWSETQDATNMANQIIVQGEGMGEEMLISTRNSIDRIQSTYKIRQNIIQAKDVSNLLTLQNHGDKELSLRQVQQQSLIIKVKGGADPIFGSYSIGDYIKVIIKYGDTDINDFFRILSIKVNVSDEDDEDVELGLGR
jgi:hypothetical protein